MAKLEKMSRFEILRIIKPILKGTFFDDEPFNYLIRNSKGKGGTEFLRDWVKDNMKPSKNIEFNKGGAVKKPKMNKGGAVHTDYRSKGLFK
tara:strand:- start:945 stop:1217 length:273 start_codon:yes stop_codon:yes gene_type:complete